MSEGKRVAIVEDDFLIADFLRELCEQDLKADVVGIAHTAEEARQMLQETQPDYVLMDVRLGGRRDGVDVAREFHERTPAARVIYVTGSNEPPMKRRMEAGAPHRILVKPISAADLRAALK